MIDEVLIAKLREKYNTVHPLLFQRSIEKANTGGELFDILSTIPDKMPIVWDEHQKRWVTSKDLIQFDLLEKCIYKKNS